MNLSAGEVLTLVGMLGGFLITIVTFARAMGKIEARVATMEKTLEENRERNDKAAADVKRDLDEKTKLLDAKVDATGSAVASLAGWMAGKFGASVPK